MQLPIKLDEVAIDKFADDANNYIFNINQHGKIYYPEKIPKNRLPNIEGKVNTGNGKLMDVKGI